MGPFRFLSPLTTSAVANGDKNGLALVTGDAGEVAGVVEQLVQGGGAGLQRGAVLHGECVESEDGEGDDEPRPDRHSYLLVFELQGLFQWVHLLSVRVGVMVVVLVAGERHPVD